MRYSRSVALALGWAAVAALAAEWIEARQGADTSRPILIGPVRVLDVTAGRYRDQQGLLVKGDRIEAVGVYDDLSRPLPAEVTRIGLDGAVVLPGLIDCHAHLLNAMEGRLEAGEAIVLSLTRTGAAARAILGTAHAREMLDAGFTTVRNVGHSGVDGDIALREAIAAGLVPGPRVLASGRKITPPGGQGVALRGTLARDLIEEEFLEITGEHEARVAVRRNLAAGVDAIKVVADDGRRVLTGAEMRAIVDEAHRAGITVGAHATTTAGIQAAIEGGVDSIEHGDEAGAAQLEAMREKRIALVPTVWTARALTDVFVNPRAASDEVRRQLLGEVEQFVRKDASRLQRVMTARVPIAAGSDMWMHYPGLTRGEATMMMFEGFVEAGMPPADAIRAGTRSAAALLRLEDRGTLEAGRIADLIAVRGDPLAKISDLRQVTFVMKGGRIVRHGR